MDRRWSWATTFLGLLVACSTSPTRASDCQGMSAGTARDECWVAHAPELFREAADPQVAIETIQTQVGDSNARDFIWLIVTREVDPSSYRYCKLIEGQALAERCRVVVSRPHLHRDISGRGGPEGAGGGPPPGGAPGGTPAGQGGPPPGGPPPGG